MGIGLTFEEFVNVKLRPNNEDVPKHRSADVRAKQLFPMKPVEVVNHLRARGYACRVESLEMLVRTGGVEPADFDAADSSISIEFHPAAIKALSDKRLEGAA